MTDKLKKHILSCVHKHYAIHLPSSICVGSEVKLPINSIILYHTTPATTHTDIYTSLLPKFISSDIHGIQQKIHDTLQSLPLSKTEKHIIHADVMNQVSVQWFICHVLKFKKPTVRKLKDVVLNFGKAARLYRNECLCSQLTDLVGPTAC